MTTGEKLQGIAKDCIGAVTMAEFTNEAKRRLLMAALTETRGHQIRAAKLLGVHRNSVARDIESLHLEPFLLELRTQRRKKPVQRAA